MSVKNVYDDEIRDTDPHEAVLIVRRSETVLQIANHLDASVTVTVSGTYSSDDGTDAVEIASKSVGADTTGSLALSEPWDTLIFEATADTAPSSGSLIAKLHDL